MYRPSLDPASQGDPAHPTDAASTDPAHLVRPPEPANSTNPVNAPVQNASYSGTSPHFELHDYAYIPVMKDTGALPVHQLVPACQAVYNNEKNIVHLQKLLVSLGREHEQTTELNKYCIIALEQALLQMISRPGVCQSGVYMFIVRSTQNDSELRRIMENPRMTGFADSLEVPAFAEEKYSVYGP